MTLWHFGGCLNIAKNNTNPDFSRFVLFAFGGSGGIRPTSLSAVSVVKRNATSFRLPEAVANDGKGQRSIRKRLDCLCQTFSCATPCRAVFGGSGGIRTPVGLHPNGFQDRLVVTASIHFRIKFCGYFICVCRAHDFCNGKVPPIEFIIASFTGGVKQILSKYGKCRSTND